MPFKIVETTEQGTKKLLVVPSAWEWKGQLRYPKKTTDFKFAKDENSSPRPDWPAMVCKLKRLGFPSYKDAEDELSTMLQNSDTDIEDRRRNISATVTNSILDFNAEADQLIFQPQHTETMMQNVITDTTEGTYYNIIGAENEIMTMEPDIITQKLDTILQNQKTILETQNKFAKRLGNFVIEIENQIEKSVTRVLKQKLNDETVCPLAKVNQNANTAFSFKPIDNVKQLEEFELMLLDPIEKQKLFKAFSILCTASDGRGITCAYKLIDILFTRQFLCNCSWSGGSRGEKIKIPLKKYKNILDFCYNMVHSWDKLFTIEENEFFFKIVLRNAEQRKKVKYIRRPTQRRSRKVKKQTDNSVKTNVKTNEKTDNAMQKKNETDMEKEVELEMEQEVEKETVNEANLDEELEVESGKETDVDEEIEKESETETDADEEMENESEKETGADEEIEKESEKNPEKGTDADKKEKKEREKDINMEEEVENGNKKEKKERKMVQKVLQNENKYKPNAVKKIKTVDKEDHSIRKPTKEHKVKVLKRIKPVNDQNSNQTPPKKQKPMKVLNN